MFLVIIFLVINLATAFAEIVTAIDLRMVTTEFVQRQKQTALRAILVRLHGLKKTGGGKGSSPS